MASRQTFIAEIAVDLEYFLKTAHHQPLQIQLGSNAKIQLHIQRIVVRGKRFGRRAAGDGVHHWCFHFQITMAHEKFAYRLYRLAAYHKHTARLFAHDQIDMTLAILLFLICQAVEFFWQGAQCLGQQAQLAHAYRQLAGFGLEQHTDCAQNIAQIIMFERVMRSFAGIAIADVELHAPAHILQRRKTGLAHHAFQHHASGNAHLDRRGIQHLVAEIAVTGVQISRQMFTLKIIGKGYALCAYCSQFGAAFGDDFVFV